MVHKLATSWQDALAGYAVVPSGIGIATLDNLPDGGKVKIDDTIASAYDFARVIAVDGQRSIAAATKEALMNLACSCGKIVNVGDVGPPSTRDLFH